MQRPENCFIYSVSSRFLQRATLEWWQRHACHGAGLLGDFYYVKERQLKDVCVLIEGYPNAVAQYVRTTLLYAVGIMVIVQDSTVLPDTEPFACHEQVRQVKLGRQALRW